MHMSIDLSNSYLETAIVTERHNMGVYGICKWGGGGGVRNLMV